MQANENPKGVFLIQKDQPGRKSTIEFITFAPDELPGALAFSIKECRFMGEEPQWRVLWFAAGRAAWRAEHSMHGLLLALIPNRLGTDCWFANANDWAAIDHDAPAEWQAFEADPAGYLRGLWGM